MKKLKKYSKDKDALSLREKILSYKNQTENVLKNNSSVGYKSRITSPLISIIPLAAASLTPFALAAQCSNSIFDPSNVVPADAAGDGDDMSVDVNGDGTTDFTFDASTGTAGGGSCEFADLFVKPKNGAEVIAYPAPISPYFYVTKFDCNDAITSANTDWRESADLPSGSDNQATMDFQNAAGGGGAWQDDNCVDVTGIVAIRINGNQMGFMEVTWNNNNLLTVNPALTGVQSSAVSGNTSVNACDCAALGVTLPIDLISFDVKLEGKNTLLNWATANEINNAGFEIQRSTDGSDYRKIGWVNGQGNASKRIDYRFADENMQTNVEYYYRLKQIDHNGSFNYSEVVTSLFKDNRGFVFENISPNPSDAGFVTARILSTQDQELEIYVIDNMGKLQITKFISIGEGINFYKLNVNELTAGTYFVKIANGDQSNFKKLIIQ